MITYLKNSILGGLSVLLLTAITLGVISNNDSLFESQAASSSVIIAEIYAGGGSDNNASSPYTRDYICLYNTSNSSVSMSTWRIQFAGATSPNWTTSISSLGTIYAKSYYLVVLGAAGTNGLTLSGNLTSASGSFPLSGVKVALVSSSTALTGVNPSSDPSVVDFLGYGTANGYEGSVFDSTNLTSSTVITRKIPMVDLDDNSTDFEIASPNPLKLSDGSQLNAAETYSNTFLSTTDDKAGLCTSAGLSWSSLSSSYTSLSRAARTEFIQNLDIYSIINAQERYIYLREIDPSLTNFANL